MNKEIEIQLSGPFSVFDSLGRSWPVKAMRIFNEGYGVLEVYVDLDQSMDDEPVYEDPVVLRQLMSRLRALGYAGPEFGSAAPEMQDDKLIVLLAPEDFQDFAASKGWKNLAEEYMEEDIGNEVYQALMQRLRRT